MTAGDDLQRVRLIEASTDETIEIRWRRRVPIGSPAGSDPGSRLDEIYIQRYTAPPPSTWEARAKEPRA